MSKPWDKLRAPVKPVVLIGTGTWTTSTGGTVEVLRIGSDGMDFTLSGSGLSCWSWRGLRDLRDFLTEVIQEQAQ